MPDPGLGQSATSRDERIRVVADCLLDLYAASPTGLDDLGKKAAEIVDALPRSARPAGTPLAWWRSAGIRIVREALDAYDARTAEELCDNDGRAVAAVLALEAALQPTNTAPMEQGNTEGNC